MNPIMMNVMTMLKDIQFGNTTEGSIPSQQSQGFFPLLLASMHPSKMNTAVHHSRQIKSKTQTELYGEDGVAFLKHSLMKMGKPLYTLAIGAQDVQKLKAFLKRCGYSPADTDPILKELMIQNPKGEILLSDFFRRIEELEIPGREFSLSMLLDESAQLRLESILRDMGLSPETSAQIIRESKMDDGSLNLDRFIAKLKRKTSDLPIFSGDAFVPQIETILKDMGLSLNDISGIVSRIRPTEGGWNIQPSAHPLMQLTSPTHIHLDISEIPRFEKILRDGGLSATTVNQVLDRARIDNGGLDYDRFIAALNKHLSSMTTSTEKAIVSGLENVMKQMGYSPKSHVLEKTNLTHTSIQPFGQFESKNEKGTGVKTAVDQILEKVVTREGATDTTVLIPSHLKSTTGDPLFKNRYATQTPFDEKSNLNPVNAFKPSGSRSAGEVSELIQKGESLIHPKDADGVKKDAQSPVFRTVLEEKSLEGISAGMSRTVFSESTHRAEHQFPGARPFPAYLMDQVGRQVSRLILTGDKEIRLQLKPPELGALKIELNFNANGLRLGMIAESSSVKDVLLSHISHLRDQLSEQGIKLDRVDVQVNDSFDSSLADMKDGSNTGFNRGKNEFQGHVPNVMQSSDTIIPGDDDIRPLDSSSSLSGYRLVDVLA